MLTCSFYSSNDQKKRNCSYIHNCIVWSMIAQSLNLPLFIQKLATSILVTRLYDIIINYVIT